MSILKPPQLRVNPKVTHSFRYVSATGSQTVIYSGDLIAACGNIAVLTTSLYAIAATAKLNSIRIWSPPASQGSNVTCSVNWFGGPQSPNVNVSDTTVSVTAPAQIFTKPPRMSLASFWVTEATSTDLFDITAPSGSIIDVSISFIFTDSVVGTSVNSTVSGKSVGQIYYAGLDGTFSSSTFKPVSLPN